MNTTLKAIEGDTKTSILEAIDFLNYSFIGSVKSQFSSLELYTTASLEWLMIEHYQFSLSNTRFLANAAAASESFDTRAVHQELCRNLSEETNHAAIYKSSLMAISLNVDDRKEFISTTNFLNTIDRLSSGSPSAVLGTIYATETAAVFEHEVFKSVSEEVLRRRGIEASGKQLVWFHDMHLSGIEQSHSNALGIFIEGLAFNTIIHRNLDRPTIDTKQVLEGAELAIQAMSIWWFDLLRKLRDMSKSDKSHLDKAV